MSHIHLGIEDAFCPIVPFQKGNDLAARPASHHLYDRPVDFCCGINLPKQPVNVDFHDRWNAAYIHYETARYQSTQFIAHGNIALICSTDSHWSLVSLV